MEGRFTSILHSLMNYVIIFKGEMMILKIGRNDDLENLIGNQ